MPFFLVSFFAFTSASILDLSPFIGNINLKTRNLTLHFDKASIVNGKLDFDNIIVDTGRNFDETIKVVRNEDLVKSIDYSVDPCIDFYGHVCSGWKSKHPIPSNESSMTQSTMIANKLYENLAEVLANKSVSPPRREVNLMHLYFEKCVENLKRKDSSALPQLYDVLRKIRQSGTSTVLTDWMILMRPLSLFYEMKIAPDKYNSSRHIMHIGPATATLKHQSYFHPVYNYELVGLRNFLYGILELLVTDDRTNEIFALGEISRRVESFIKIDQILAKLRSESEQTVVDVIVGWNELPTVIPSIQWKAYFRSFLPSETVNSLNSQEILVSDTVAISRIEDLIGTLDSQTILDYIDWKTIFFFGPFLDKKYQQVMTKFEEDVTGVKKLKTNRTCIDQVNNAFSEVLGRRYIEHFFSPETRTEIAEMIDNIRREFVDLLEENDWMDVNTKIEAKAKAASVKHFIGYSNDIFNFTRIEGKYKNAAVRNAHMGQIHNDEHMRRHDFCAHTFSEDHRNGHRRPSALMIWLKFDYTDSYLSIYRKISSWNQMNNFEKLQVTSKKEEFDFPAAEINAFYDPNHNNIAILAGILVPPYFDAENPRLLNYGGIGVIIGHEFTHGFDDYGSQFDMNGNKRNWWGEETGSRFMKKAKCLEYQYSAIEVDKLDVKINGKRTLGENIADNGGMKLAFRAAEKQFKSQNFVMQGLEKYKPEQLFFLSYAFTWCGNARKQLILEDVASNLHSPDVYRVNVVLSNQPEFSKAFNCPAGMPMNPHNKCTLW